MTGVRWLCLMLLPGMAFADDLPQCGDRPIQFAYYTYGYFYRDGRGIDVDLVAELRSRTGCRFETREIPRSRIWKQLEKGGLDMAGAAISTPERERFAWFADYAALKAVAVYHMGALSIVTPHDIIYDDRITIGVVRSFKHGAVIDRLIDEVRRRRPDRIEEVSDEKALFRILEGHRVKIVFAQRSSVILAGLSDLRMVDIAPSEAPIRHGLVMSRSHFGAAEAAKWQHLVAEMVADGTVRRIMERFAPPSVVPDLLPHVRVSIKGDAPLRAN